MIRKFAALGTIAALAFGAQCALAEGFSYNLLEGSYTFGKVESVDGKGFGLNGSSELTTNMYLFSGYNQLDFNDADVDTDNLNIGIGFNFPLSDNLDVNAGASFERSKFSVSGIGSDSESGYGISAGVRGRAMEQLEVSAALKYTDIGDFGHAFTYTAGVRWYFVPNFAVGADYRRVDLGSEADAKGNAWVIVLRYDFGDRK